MVRKSIILPSVFGLAILAGGSANAAPVNLAGLGLVAAAAPFAAESASTSLFGGTAFSADSFAAPVTLNIAVSGSLPFGGTDFAISAFPTVGSGTLTGTSTHVGWDIDMVQVLLSISSNTGVFSGVSPRVLAEVTGSFGSDPLGLGGGSATLGVFVPSTVTLTNVNEIPLPAALPVMVLALGGATLLLRRGKA